MQTFVSEIRLNDLAEGIRDRSEQDAARQDLEPKAETVSHDRYTGS